MVKKEETVMPKAVDPSWETRYPTKARGLTITQLRAEIKRIRGGKSYWEYSQAKRRRIRGIEQKIGRIQVRNLAKKNRKFGRRNIVIISPVISPYGGAIQLRKATQDWYAAFQGVYFDREGFSHYGELFAIQVSEKEVGMGGLFSYVRPIEARHKPFFSKGVRWFRKQMQPKGIHVYILPKRFKEVEEVEKSDLFFTEGAKRAKIPVKKIIKSRRKVWTKTQTSRYDRNMKVIQQYRIPEEMKKDIATLSRSTKVAKLAGRATRDWIQYQRQLIVFDLEYESPKGKGDTKEVMEFIQAKYGKGYNPNRFIETPSPTTLRETVRAFNRMTTQELVGLSRRGVPGRRRTFGWTKAYKPGKIDWKDQWIKYPEQKELLALAILSKRKRKGITKKEYQLGIKKIINGVQRKQKTEREKILPRMKRKRERIIAFYSKKAVRKT